MTKEYKIFKSIRKTAKENNLIIAEQVFYGNQKALFDFSLLNGLDFSEEEKEIIKNDAIKNIKPSNRVSFYGNESDQFTYCFGKAQYHIQRVYSLEGKLRYKIFSLARIEHHHCERNSIMENYSDIKINSSNGYDEAISDIEL
jgi:hypothetical protein